MTGSGRLAGAIPEVVFFDVGDTLVRAHPSWAAVYLSVFPRWGIETSETDLQQALHEATAAGAWDDAGEFEASEEASWARIRAFDASVLAALGHPDVPDEFFRDIWRAFEARGSWHVFPDAVPVLESLHDAGFRLGVISNWLWNAPDLLHTLELAKHFEQMSISARVGFQKPNRGIFEHALQQMGVPAERAVHVGDSYRADVEGARGVGLRAVLIDRAPGDAARFHGAEGAQHQRDVPVIRDLFELLDLLAVPRPASAGAARS